MTRRTRTTGTRSPTPTPDHFAGRDVQTNTRWLHAFWGEVFDADPPSRWWYGYGALWAVPKSYILARPLADWDRLRKALADDVLSGYEAETLWPWMFGAEPKAKAGPIPPSKEYGASCWIAPPIHVGSDIYEGLGDVDVTLTAQESPPNPEQPGNPEPDPDQPKSYNRVYDETGTGGLVGAGDAPHKARYGPQASDGSTASGSSAPTVTSTHEGQGGTVASGVAQVGDYRVYHETGTGGVLVPKAATVYENRLLHSADLMHPVWRRSGFSPDGTSWTAPDGTPIPVYSFGYGYIFQDGPFTHETGQVGGNRCYIRANYECQIGFRRLGGSNQFHNERGERRPGLATDRMARRGHRAYVALATGQPTHKIAEPKASGLATAAVDRPRRRTVRSDDGRDGD